MMLCVALSALLAGCRSEQNEGTTSATKGGAQATKTPVRQPIVDKDKLTTDGRAIVGSLVLASPTELRLYIHPTFPGNKRASIRGTVTVDGGSTIPAPLYQTMTMDYYVAMLTEEVKPPVSVTLRVEADGYKQAEIKSTVTAMMSAPDQAQPMTAASNPREDTQLILTEIARLREVVDQGKLSLVPGRVRMLEQAVGDLALMKGEKAEVALQPALNVLHAASTSMTLAAGKGSAAEVKALLEEIEKTIERDVRPHFVME
jgi:hypothetical protein